ncbi:MAG: RNA-binding transcriptional accessory protein, partial [Erysipelotrichaceae bacterium]|nr:RNA-binding transcriptional accessory protein [Erysipelotrichaceae bacterium]
MIELMKPIAETLGIKVTQVENTLALLEEGNTVPFIARYRKEKTEGLDEEQILYIEEQYTYQKNLQKRKEDVLRLIETQGKLTEEIKAEVAACTKISQVDDIYRPYMQKKKTRAAAAIAKGLQPLADWIVRCPYKGNVEQEAAKYVKDEVKSVEEALQGAMDIIAEMVSDDAKLRWKAKDSITTRGRMITKEKKNHEDAGKVYQMYYDFSTKVSGIPHHQIMAIDRAEKEKVITVSFDYNEEYQINYAYQRFTHHRETIVHDILMEAITDGYKRLLLPSVEREVRNDLSEKAQAHSIEVFAMNLEKLLLQPPLKGKMVLGFDP